MRLLFVLVTLASLGIPALADPGGVPARSSPPDVTKMASDDCARARALHRTCVLSIEGEQVEGTVATSGEPQLAVIGFTSHASLIRLRRDFIVELLKTAEDL
ncbi:MAG: hypothetical protein M3680_27930 [Myxococcota bacterium]|nr:hypothetical protein [Myxococcota bacterium]